mgnify:CR=1 FL=1
MVFLECDGYHRVMPSHWPVKAPGPVAVKPIRMYRTHALRGRLLPDETPFPRRFTVRLRRAGTSELGASGTWSFNEGVSGAEAESQKRLGLELGEFEVAPFGLGDPVLEIELGVDAKIAPALRFVLKPAKDD